MFIGNGSGGASVGSKFKGNGDDGGGGGSKFNGKLAGKPTMLAIFGRAGSAGRPGIAGRAGIAI